MLSIQELTENTATAIQKLASRNQEKATAWVKTAIRINEQRKQQQQTSDTLANELKKKTAEIAELLRAGTTYHIDNLKQQVANIKHEHKKATAMLRKHEHDLKDALLAIPNLPNNEVPIGKDSQDNKIIQTWQGVTPQQHALLPHWELVNKYDIVDFELGNKITGAGFPVYKKKGAQLQRALINFFLDQANQAGYQEMGVPILVNENAALGTGQLPDKEGMMYALQENDKYLIPTAEVPLTNLYRDCTLHDEKNLPIKLIGYTPCFRREAGSWGRHVRGLNRLHQFDKVEAVIITTPQKAAQELQNMSNYVASLLQKLGLTYRIVQLCTGDLGFTAAITYDFEVWSAGQQKWLEVSSVSCFDDYQARRLNLRYHTAHKPKYCYTLNGSALALPRILAALLENYQRDNHIAIPDVLHTYASFKQIIPSVCP